MTSRALFRGSWAGFLALLLVASGCESSDEGELEVLIADDLERGLSWEEYDVRMSDGRRIRLDTEGRKLGLQTGTRVRVSGGEWLASSRVRNPLVVATAEPDDGVVSITSAIIPSTPPPPRKVAVILFNFAGGTDVHGSGRPGHHRTTGCTVDPTRTGRCSCESSGRTASPEAARPDHGPRRRPARRRANRRRCSSSPALPVRSGPRPASSIASQLRRRF